LKFADNAALPTRIFRTFLKPAFFLKPASLAYWNLPRDATAPSIDAARGGGLEKIAHRFCF